MTDRQAFAYIQQHCEPGDIRIRHFKFSTENVSIVAFKRGNELDAEAIGGVAIGAVAPGRMAAGETLTPISAVHEANIALPKFFLSLGSLVTTFLIFTNPRRRILAITVFAWAIVMLRSIVWDSDFLRPRFWGGFGAVCVPFLIRLLVR
jgi:hypothetical protein